MSEDVDAENALRTVILAFMDDVRDAEHTVAAQRSAAGATAGETIARASGGRPGPARCRRGDARTSCTSLTAERRVMSRRTEKP
jgi:hypothetical protein